MIDTAENRAARGLVTVGSIVAGDRITYAPARQFHVKHAARREERGVNVVDLSGADFDIEAGEWSEPQLVTLPAGMLVTRVKV